MSLETVVRQLKPIEAPIENRWLRWLYLHLPPQPITRKKTYQAYVQAVDILMHERLKEDIDTFTSQAIARYLSAVIPFIETYEKKTSAINPATPEEMLTFLMEQNDLSQYDLAKDLGGQPVVSDILRGKRKLTRDHIECLSKRFHISPASFYPAH